MDFNGNKILGIGLQTVSSDYIDFARWLNENGHETSVFVDNKYSVLVELIPNVIMAMEGKGAEKFAMDLHNDFLKKRNKKGESKC